MELNEVLHSLCAHDPRHPMFYELHGELDPDQTPAARSDCSCDNCFYGRDRLALEILRLRAESGNGAG